MAKEFIDELIDTLKELKETEINNFYDKLDEGELPKLPLTPLTVMKTVNKVALNHKVTKDELANLLALDGLTAQEVQVINEFSEKQ